jgi:hypothetical protein
VPIYQTTWKNTDISRIDIAIGLAFFASLGTDTWYGKARCWALVYAMVGMMALWIL